MLYLRRCSGAAPPVAGGWPAQPAPTTRWRKYARNHTMRGGCLIGAYQRQACSTGTTQRAAGMCGGGSWPGKLAGALASGTPIQTWQPGMLRQLGQGAHLHGLDGGAVAHSAGVEARAAGSRALQGRAGHARRLHRDDVHGHGGLHGDWLFGTEDARLSREACARAACKWVQRRQRVYGGRHPRS